MQSVLAGTLTEQDAGVFSSISVSVPSCQISKSLDEEEIPE